MYGGTDSEDMAGFGYVCIRAKFFESIKLHTTSHVTGMYA